MKWYQKAIIALEQRFIPESQRKQMMGTGRETVPANANPWNIFNWLPKKFQTAHTIDLTKLQNCTAEELLELLVSVHPDVSHALHTYLRMGDTELSFKADNEHAQSTLDGLVDMLNTPLASPGYQHGRSLDKLDGIQRLMVMVRGACAGEVVLDENVRDVVDIVPVDPSLIWFRRDPETQRLTPWQFVKFPKYRTDAGETWFGQYKLIDTPTFIYEELDPLVDDPYGRTPILPVLQIVFFHLQVLQDLKAVVHNQGYPRMTVKLLEEIMLKNMPQKYRNDPNAQRQWLGDRLKDVQNQFKNLNPDDALIGWDSVEYGYVQVQGSGSVVNVKSLIDVIDTQLATALKTLLTLLSRHQGSTETYSSVDVQLYIKTVESARNVSRRFWERALSVACRVKGVKTSVEAEYAPIDLRSEQQQANDMQSVLENLESAESNFYITGEEATTEARKMLGFDADIPPELSDKLKQKHEQPETPMQEDIPNPHNTNKRTSRMKLAATATDDTTDSKQAEEEYIILLAALFGHLAKQVKHATTLDAVKAMLKVSDGIQTQMSRGLFQLYRTTYINSYNSRALATGSARINAPDINTSVRLQTEAKDVIEGVVKTYEDELDNAYSNALEQAANLPESERLAEVKRIMNEWADKRAEWKASEVAGHEAANGYHEGMFAHDSVNAPDTMYEVQPTTTNHEACAEIIANAPYTLDEAQNITLPLHPNCPHRFVPLEGGE